MAAITLSLCSANLPAEEAVELEPVVVTATRLAQPLKYTASSVTLIGEREIKEQQAVTVSEVLRNIAGVEVQRSGTMGEQTLVRMRGAENAHTLVLLDGVEINSPWFGDFDFADLMVDNIEQIEVVRGPQSALYGSEGMGGVINIVTKKGHGELEFSPFVEGGNQGSYREGLDISGAWKEFNYSLSFSRTDIGGQFDRDQYGNYSVSGQLGFDITDRVSLELMSRYINAQKELGLTINEFVNPLEVFLDENNILEKEFANTTLRYNQVMFDWWKLKLTGSVVDDGSETTNPLDSGPILPNFSNLEDIEFTTYHLDFQNSLYPVEWAALATGFEYEVDKLSHFQSFSLQDVILLEDSSSRKRNNKAFYLQCSFSWKDSLFFNPGVRIDDYSDFGTDTNVKLSAAYSVEPIGTKLRGGWGTGFRAPDFRHLFFPVFGNPNLKPENSESYEIGLEQSLWKERIDFDVTYFHQHFKDLIDINPVTLAATNIGRAVSEGVELGLQITPTYNLRLKANYTYLDTEDRQTGNELAGRSRNRWNFNLCYHLLERLHLNLDLNLVSSQFVEFDIIDLNGNLLRGRNQGYSRLDMALTYDFAAKSRYTSEFQLFGKIDNLFNDDYHEVKGFPAPGTLFLAGVRMTL